MKAIWKFPIPLGVITGVEVDPGASVKHVDADPASGHPAVWIEVDTDADKTERLFRVFGTGHEIEAGWEHRGSFVEHGGYVWHIYELARAA
jgi:hypothetical protein